MIYYLYSIWVIFTRFEMNSLSQQPNKSIMHLLFKIAFFFIAYFKKCIFLGNNDIMRKFSYNLMLVFV